MGNNTVFLMNHVPIKYWSVHYKTHIQNFKTSRIFGTSKFRLAFEFSITRHKAFLNQDFQQEQNITRASINPNL